ncbi:hypothetical protein V2G26_017016 [Clonostachys chloroleuca]
MSYSSNDYLSYLPSFARLPSYTCLQSKHFNTQIQGFSDANKPTFDTSCEKNKILAPSLEGNKITWSDIIRPKISSSNPKLTGFTKAISITDINQLNQIILDNLSIEQIILLFNFSQDIRLNQIG